MKPHVIIIISLAVTITALFVVVSVLSWQLKGASATYFHNYLGAIGSVGFYLTIISIFFKISFDNHDDDFHTTLKKIKYARVAWESLQTFIMANYPYTAEIGRQIFPFDPLYPPPQKVINTNKEEVYNNYVANIIFRYCGDYILSADLPESAWRDINPTSMDYEFYSIMVSWFASPIVRRIWNSCKIFFSLSTVDIVDKYVIPQSIKVYPERAYA